MITLLIILLSSLWSILIVDYFTPFQQLKDYLGFGYKRTIYSENSFIDYILYFIHKVISCSLCMSCYIFFFAYWIYFNSLCGFFLIPIAYFVTFLLKEKIFTISL